MASTTRGIPENPHSSFRWVGNLENLRARIVQDGGGELSSLSSPYVAVAVHMGAPSLVGCRRGDEQHSGIARHGDIDLIPPNTQCTWIVPNEDTVLAIGIHPDLISYAAQESGCNPDEVLISNRFQIKDPQLEHLCWAIRSEMEAGYPCGKVYTDSIATAIAARIVHHHSSVAQRSEKKARSIAPAKLRQVMAFIEDRLSENLSLADIATYAGMSVSHFKAVFRETVGQPVHRYLVQRRVERAAWMLKNQRTPIADIALQTGFSHQSHLALQMRRILGQSPKDLRKNLG
jgi:AraC family transcriptional regulator